MAGSFQTLGPGDIFDAATAVPRFDGLHLVEQGRHSTGHRRTSFVFLRFQDEPHLTDPGAVFIDDVRDSLLRYSSRLQVD